MWRTGSRTACSAPVTGRGGHKKLCDECKQTWKWCPRCEVLKRLADFAPNGRTVGYCADCHSAYNGARYDAEYHYRYHLRRKFGISDAEAARLAAVEDCEICGARPAPDERLHVDHDHATGAVRGVLCRWCNYAVSVLEDERLAQLEAYLRAAAKRRLTVVGD